MYAFIHKRCLKSVPELQYKTPTYIYLYIVYGIVIKTSTVLKDRRIGSISAPYKLNPLTTRRQSPLILV